jgi:hypothetical protein
METTHTQWGLCPRFEDHGPQLIHPDALALVPNGKVFRAIGIVDDFVRLSYGETEFRARPSLLAALASQRDPVQLRRPRPLSGLSFDQSKFLKPPF